MWDLIVDSIGAAIASFSGYIYMVRKSGGGWLVGLIRDAITQNRASQK